MAEALKRLLADPHGPLGTDTPTGTRVQFRRMLSGLSYAEQLKLVAPRDTVPPVAATAPVQQKKAADDDEQKDAQAPGDKATQKKADGKAQTDAAKSDHDSDTAVQQKEDPAVQMEDRNASAGDRAAADTRAGGNRAAATVTDTHGGGATDAGMIARNGQSMAVNPAFEADARAFETALGPAAHSHGAAKAVMDWAALQVQVYLEVLSGTWDANLAPLAAQLKKCGHADPTTSSNRVGESAAAVKKMIESGTVGERCGMIEKFWQNIVLPEFLKPPAAGDPAARAAAGKADIDKAMLEGTMAGKSKTWFFYAKQDETTTSHPTDAGAAAQQTEAKKALNWQWHTRAPRPTDQKLPPMKVKELGGVVSPEEMLFQGVSAEGDELKWSNGENAWMMNEYDKWVVAQRQMSLPLVAGPSGTTDRIFQTLKGMKCTDMLGIRMACIGYLLPPRHHSLVEVLTAAAAHGVPFVSGQQMYTSIPPFTEPELKGFGGGKFPHEPRTT